MEPSASGPARDTESANESRLDTRIAVNDQMLVHLRAGLAALLEASNLFDEERDNDATGSDHDPNALDGLVAKRLERNLDESLRAVNVVIGDLEDRAARLARQRPAPTTTDGYRELMIGEFPEHGHMLVVSEAWDTVYWLADRHAVIRAGAVELEGPGQRLLEAPADGRGMVTFTHVREHDVASITEGTPAARAIDMLTNPTRIEETLYPPYIRAVGPRPTRPYLQPPEGLSEGAAIVLNHDRFEVYWLCMDVDRLDDSDVYAAQLGGHGPVYWGGTWVSKNHPEWVLPALIDHMRSQW